MMTIMLLLGWNVVRAFPNKQIHILGYNDTQEGSAHCFFD